MHECKSTNRDSTIFSYISCSIESRCHLHCCHILCISRTLKILSAERQEGGLYDQLRGQDRPDGHARSAFRHVDYCEDQPERLRDNQRSPEPGVLTPLATWTLLSCLFRLFLRSRSIWSKGSLWGGFWRFRQYDGTFVRNDKSFVFSRVLHKGLIIFFALEFLPIASQLQ